MKNSLLIMFVVALLAASCGGNGNSEQPVAAVEAAMAPPVETSTPSLHIADSVMAGGHKYIYKVERDPIDSVFVKDEDGNEYNDNTIRVEVKRDGAVFFQHTFMKKNFANWLDNGMLKNGVLDGCRFLKIEDGGVVFSMCVSIPLSDLSSPFFVTVDGSGAYTIAVDHTLDMDNLNDSTKLANE